MNLFEIKVNQRIFTLWESASYERSIDYLCGKFSFTSSDKTPEAYPVKRGDLVEIIINGNIVLTGYVDKVINSGSINGSFVTVSGRDKTADLVDSSIPDGVKNNEGPISLSSLCKKVIDALGIGISVSDQSGGIEPFSSDELQAASSGDNAFEFLNNFARKRQVYLITDPSGNLVIFRPGGTKATTVLRNEISNPLNNIKNWECVNDNSNRFNKYVARSQDNVGFDVGADYFGEGSNRNGSASDGEIRGSRYLEIICEESMDDLDVVERAKEEANLRRARSFSYIARLAGLGQADGSLWNIGQLLEIRDDKCNVFGTYLSKEVTLSQALDGSNTDIVAVEPDAYKVIPSKTKGTARKSKTNIGF